MIQITGDGRQLSFRGKIDRIDADAIRSRVRILDYKTGSTYPYNDIKKEGLLGGGKHLQLPIYALAIRHKFGDQCNIEASYWFITAKGKFAMKTVPLSKVEKDLSELVRVVVNGITGGIFPTNPGTGEENFNNCLYCDYKRVCPENCETISKRKAKDQILSEYVAISKKIDTEEEAV